MPEVRSSYRGASWVVGGNRHPKYEAKHSGNKVSSSGELKIGRRKMGQLRRSGGLGER